MAACSEADLLYSICAVCFERFTVPRKLPSCAHSFCEECLLKYTSSLVEDKEAIPTELPCPLCRELNHLPANGTDMKGWVTSLEIDDELVKNVETENQKDMPELCVRCKESSRPVIASRYCFECQEHFCETCCRIGHGFKILKDHSIIEITQEVCDKKQRELIKSMSVYALCKRHPENKMSFICVEEDTFCCDVCRDMFHKSCKNVKEIRQYASKDNTTEEASKLMEKLSKLSDLCKIIIQRKDENEVSNKNDTETILEKIMDMRRNMNQVFDALEDNVRQQCKGLTKECALADHEDIAKLQELVQTFDISSKLLDNALNLAPLDLIFVIQHKLQKSTEKQETTVLEFRHDFQRVGLELNLDALLQKVQALSPNEANKLTKVDVKKTDIELRNYPDRHLLRYCKIENVGEKFGTGACPELYFSGMTVLPDNRMILVDHRYGIYCLIDSKYNLVHSGYLTSAPGKQDWNKTLRGICYIKNNVAAVSVPKEKKLYFIATQAKSLEITGEVRTRYEPHALHSLSDGDIAVAWDKPAGFGVLTFNQSYTLDEKLYFDRDQRGRIMKSFLYMAVDEERSQIIQPCKIDKAVFCFDFAGSPKFTYKHPELTRPQGVTIDPDGAIYICDRDHDCIHILSAAGEPARIIREGIPAEPINVIYNRKRKEFVVANGTKSYSGIRILKVKI